MDQELTQTLVKENRHNRPNVDTFKFLFWGTICVLLFVGGINFAEHITPNPSTTLATINFVCLIGFLLSFWIKKLDWAKLPFLLVIAFTSGIQLSAWGEAHELLSNSFVILGAHLGLVAFLAYRKQFQLERFGLHLALLSLAFSLAGFSIVYAQEIAWLSFIWALAACLCFSGLLYNAVSRVVPQMQPGQYRESAASIFLLNIGLLVNVLVILSL